MSDAGPQFDTPPNAPATLRVAVRRLDNGIANGTPLPDYQTAHAAGMDIHACLAEPVVIEPGRIAMIPAGFALAVPVGYEAQVRPRSGLASKHGVTLPNAPGTIDADYRGQVQVPLINHGHAAFTVEPNMRIAQMLITPVPRVTWDEVEELPDSQRGGGFGSTGINTTPPRESASRAVSARFPTTPHRTVWHITFGTYGTRLHGDDRLTVDRQHNQLDTPFVKPEPRRVSYERNTMSAPPVILSPDQRTFIETAMDAICRQGEWNLHAVAAPWEGDHVHVLLDADADKHGKDVRRWLKRWLGEALKQEWPDDPQRWWADGGSTKAVRDEAYFERALRYVVEQRTSLHAFGDRE